LPQNEQSVTVGLLLSLNIPPPLNVDDIQLEYAPERWSFRL